MFGYALPEGCGGEMAEILALTGPHGTKSLLQQPVVVQNTATSAPKVGSEVSPDPQA